MKDAEKWLDHYLATTFNSSPKLRSLPRERLVELAKIARALPGECFVQFERLLMEAESN